MKVRHIVWKVARRADGRPGRVEGETMDQGSSYLVRYGLMGRVGRFPAPVEVGRALARGQAVVVRTERGLEVGEVLIGGGDENFGPSPEDIDSDQPQVLRTAGPDDLNSHSRALALREDRFRICRRIVDDAGWPVELLDVEPLLDPRTTVLHLLGPEDLDLALLRARFRSLLEFDVVLEPVGWDAGAGLPPAVVPATTSPGRCGDCDCGDGGCSRTAAKTAAATSHREEVTATPVSCATSSHSGCSSCGVTRWLADKRSATV
jgi:hypothetical protein